MIGYAATAVVILAACFGTAAPSTADKASTAEIGYSPIDLETYSVPTATSGNESEIAATSETATSDPLESTLSSEFSSDDSGSNSTEPSYDDLFDEINARAAGDREFQRTIVQLPICCFSNTKACDTECTIQFVESVESPGAVTNGTVPVTVCFALYGLLGCAEHHDVDADLCMEYCRCFSSDPWLDTAGGVMSALLLVSVLLTLAVYACVPRLRNLHGQCFLSYLVAVLAGECVSALGSWLVCGDPGPAVGGAAVYLSLVRYCWVNLLCVDVYCTCQPFQSVRQPPPTGRFSRERRRLVYFSAAAWGGSALVFGLVEGLRVPHKSIVYTGIILLLLVASCVPLVLTLVRIWRTKRQTKKNCLSISKMKLNWFYLTSKLLCLSGAGKLATAVAYYTLRHTPYYQWLFVALKVEGPILLFLFVWNVRVRGLVRQRLTTLEWISVHKSNDNCSTLK